MSQNYVEYNGSAPFTEADVDAGIVFILFSKNAIANESSLKGYFADITLKNISNTYAELFSIGSEVVPSSK